MLGLKFKAYMYVVKTSYILWVLHQDFFTKYSIGKKHTQTHAYSKDFVWFCLMQKAAFKCMGDFVSGMEVV